MNRLHFLKRKDFELDYTDNELSDYEVANDTPSIEEDEMSSPLASDYYDDLLSTGKTPSHSSDESWWEDEVHCKPYFEWMPPQQDPGQPLDAQGAIPTPIEDNAPDRKLTLDGVIKIWDTDDQNIDPVNEIGFIPLFYCDTHGDNQDRLTGIDTISNAWQQSHGFTLWKKNRDMSSDAAYLAWYQSIQYNKHYFYVPYLITEQTPDQNIDVTFEVEAISTEYACDHNDIGYYPFHSTYKDIFTNQNDLFPQNVRTRTSEDQLATLPNLPYETATQGGEVTLRYKIQPGVNEVFDNELYSLPFKTGIHLLKLGFYYRIQARFIRLTVKRVQTYLPETAFLRTVWAENIPWHAHTSNYGNQYVYDADTGALVFGPKPPAFETLNNDEWVAETPLNDRYYIPTIQRPPFSVHPIIYMFSDEFVAVHKNFNISPPNEIIMDYNIHEETFNNAIPTALDRIVPYATQGLHILPNKLKEYETITKLYCQPLDYFSGKTLHPTQIIPEYQYGKFYGYCYVSYEPYEHYVTYVQPRIFPPEGRTVRFTDLSVAQAAAVQYTVLPPLRCVYNASRAIDNVLSIRGGQVIHPDEVVLIREYTGVINFNEPSSISYDVHTTGIFTKQLDIKIPFLVTEANKKAWHTIQIVLTFLPHTVGVTANIVLGYYKNNQAVATQPRRLIARNETILLNISFCGTGLPNDNSNFIGDLEPGVHWLPFVITLTDMTPADDQSFIYNIHHVGTYLPIDVFLEHIELLPNDFNPPCNLPTQYPALLMPQTNYTVRHEYIGRTRYECRRALINGLGRIAKLYGNISIPYRFSIDIANDYQTMVVPGYPFPPFMGSLLIDIDHPDEANYENAEPTTATGQAARIPSLHSVTLIRHPRTSQSYYPSYELIRDENNDWTTEDWTP